MLKERLDDYKMRSAKVKNRRDKYLVHSNYKTVAGVTPVSESSRKEIEDILEALRAFMRLVEVHFAEDEIWYENAVTRDDGDTLISWLARGLRHRELQDERVIGWDDFKKSKWWNC